MAISVAQIEKALVQASGNVSDAARQLSVSRMTIYRKIQRSPKLQTILTDAREELVDIAESKIKKEIEAGNITAIIFTLKTQGKSRGWVERQEITGADGGKLDIKLKWDNDDADGNAP